MVWSGSQDADARFSALIFLPFGFALFLVGLLAFFVAMSPPYRM
jgi:hypothetical protein